MLELCIWINVNKTVWIYFGVCMCVYVCVQGLFGAMVEWCQKYGKVFGWVFYNRKMIVSVSCQYCIFAQNGVLSVFSLDKPVEGSHVWEQINRSQRRKIVAARVHDWFCSCYCCFSDLKQAWWFSSCHCCFSNLKQAWWFSSCYCCFSDLKQVWWFSSCYCCFSDLKQAWWFCSCYCRFSDLKQAWLYYICGGHYQWQCLCWWWCWLMLLLLAWQWLLHVCAEYTWCETRCWWRPTWTSSRRSSSKISTTSPAGSVHVWKLCVGKKERWWDVEAPSWWVEQTQGRRDEEALGLRYGEAPSW